MSTAALPVYEWNDLNWPSIEKQVFKLQKRIYRATRRGDARLVHRLQRLLIRSWAARCLAVRRVTQDHQGKKTAGVDGVKSLTPKQRLALVATLALRPTASPTRRVWIPKPGTTEQRPLGIPTLHDRAAQALAKLSLEPEWEAKFEPNSYGFRPGRSCHDAIEAIFGSIKQKPKYILDADIAHCFDRINHAALLRKLQTFPLLRRAIKAWLNAGVMDQQELFPTHEGTPQGGVISPLLANIALHGLETTVVQHFKRRLTLREHGSRRRIEPTLIRYADDFVILDEDDFVINQAYEVVNMWLQDMGLMLKPSKTRMSHTLLRYEGTCGVDFLGFHVRQYPVGKTHSGTKKAPNRAPETLGFKTLIKPSTEAQRRHLRVIAERIRKHSHSPHDLLIKALNPVIRGWTTYYATVAAARTFAILNHKTYLKLRAWAKRRHPTKGWQWVIKHYWHPDQGRWDFKAPDGAHLYRHSDTHIHRHRKVKDARSPYDGDWVYWTSRLGRHPELSSRTANLLYRQQGKCAWCGLYLRQEDVLEIDHVLRTSLGGAHGYKNWQLIHRHCHDQKTAVDGPLAGNGAHDTGHSVEEPCEVESLTHGFEAERSG